MEQRMTTWIDEERCDNCQRCTKIAPEVFTVVNGNIRLKEDSILLPENTVAFVPVNGAIESRVKAAIKNCPNSAIDGTIRVAIPK
jgi:ferredoxin